MARKIATEAGYYAGQFVPAGGSYDAGDEPASVPSPAPASAPLNGAGDKPTPATSPVE